jgi:hypothetical protein
MAQNQFLFYVNYINLLDKIINTLNENTEDLLVSDECICL